MEAIKFNTPKIFQNSNLRNNTVSYDQLKHFNNIQDSVSFSGKVSKPQNKLPAHIQKLVDRFEIFFDYVSTKSKPAEEYVKEVASHSQILMLGEEHQHLGAKKFIISMLNSLKKLGYSDVAVEVPSKFQPHIDSFLEGKLSEHGLSKLTKPKLADGSRWTPLQSVCPIKMLNECKKLGLKVHCIDSRDEDFINKLFDKNFVSTLQSGGSYTTSRDKQTFDNLNNKIFAQQPDAKVIIVFGPEHVIKSQTAENPNRRLRQFIDDSDKKVHSIHILKPEYINDFVDTSKFKANVGFSTTDKSIADLAYSAGENSFNPKPMEYYGKHLDGIVVVD